MVITIRNRHGAAREQWKIREAAELSEDTTEGNFQKLDIDLKPISEVPNELMKATLEGLARWEAKHGLNQDE